MILAPYSAIASNATVHPKRPISQPAMRFGGIVMSRLTGQKDNTPQRTHPENFLTQFYRRHLIRVTATIANTGQQWLQKIGLLQAAKAPHESMMLAFSASGRALMDDIDLPPVKSFQTEPMAPKEPPAKSTSHDFKPEASTEVIDKAHSRSSFTPAQLPEDSHQKLPPEKAKPQPLEVTTVDMVDDLSASTSSSIEMVEYPQQSSRINPDDLEAGWSLVEEEARNGTSDQQFQKPSGLSGLHKRFSLRR